MIRRPSRRDPVMVAPTCARLSQSGSAGCSLRRAAGRVYLVRRGKAALLGPRLSGRLALVSNARLARTSTPPWPGKAPPSPRDHSRPLHGSHRPTKSLALQSLPPRPPLFTPPLSHTRIAPAEGTKSASLLAHAAHRGRYDAACERCNSTSFSAAGAADCTPFSPCPPGFARTSTNVTYAGVCTACAPGYYKDAGLKDSWGVQCAEIPFCNAGSYRQVWPSPRTNTRLCKLTHGALTRGVECRSSNRNPM